LSEALVVTIITRGTAAVKERTGTSGHAAVTDIVGLCLGYWAFNAQKQNKAKAKKESKPARVGS